MTVDGGSINTNKITMLLCKKITYSASPFVSPAILRGVFGRCGQFMRQLWNRLGVYRTLPVFFVFGAGIEWFMIHVRVGKETFCKLIRSDNHFHSFSRQNAYMCHMGIGSRDALCTSAYLHCLNLIFISMN